LFRGGCDHLLVSWMTNIRSFVQFIHYEPLQVITIWDIQSVSVSEKTSFHHLVASILYPCGFLLQVQGHGLEECFYLLCISDSFLDIHLAGAYYFQVNCFHASTKGIDHPILFSFNMFDFKIKLVEEGHPPSLSGIEIWLVKQISQSIVVCHKYKFSSQEVMPPHFQGVHYGGQL
jgi:hypothetical protein